MKPHLRIEMIRFQNGERYPLLISSETNMPLYKPTVYATSILRNRGLAESTIKTNLVGIQFLYVWTKMRGIDIEKRFREGKFLELSEIESLCTSIKNRLDVFCDDIPFEFQKKVVKPRRKLRFRRFQYKVKRKSDNCILHTVATRLRYIRNYLDWLAELRLARVSSDTKEYSMLSDLSQTMRIAINARIPKVSKWSIKDPDFERLGLTHEVEELLKAAIIPNSKDNPFKNKHVKVRNQLLVNLMLETGIRRGETLEIRVSDNDLDLQNNTVTIHRIPIDPSDTRLHKPQTKTKPRRLPLSPSVSKMAREYVTMYRRRLPNAGKHPFLFVESKKGNPMSLAALNDVFSTLRDTVTELPKGFSAHWTRYTWNDRFSEFADEKIKQGHWTIDDEQKARCQQMGWQETSKMAAIYARRHNKKKADEFSLKRQERIFRQDAEVYDSLTTSEVNKI